MPDEKMERFLEELCQAPIVEYPDDPEFGGSIITPCDDCDGCSSAKLIRALMEKDAAQQAIDASNRIGRSVQAELLRREKAIAAVNTILAEITNGE